LLLLHSSEKPVLQVFSCHHLYAWYTSCLIYIFTTQSYPFNVSAWYTFYVEPVPRWSTK
jgi:hypothetical protein